MAPATDNETVGTPVQATNPAAPGASHFSGAIRGAVVFAMFLGFTVPLMPVQAALKRLAPRSARTFPHWYHKRVCALLGIRMDVRGAIVRDRPVLVVANHTSWLDIPVLSAVAPVSFVAKREVDGWPGIGMLARLQRTVFVDRERRQKTGETAGEISSRLATGDAVVLFAEGTSSDGNRVLPFRSALFAAAVPPGRQSAPAEAEAAGGATTASAPAPTPVVQTVAVVYSRLHGVPLGRADRHLVGWYGDMDMIPHGWGVLCAGPIDVVVEVGAPIEIADFADRKHLSRATEDAVRSSVLALLRNGA